MVTNGLFTVLLDFGNQFPGTNRWLEIDVRTNGTGAFTTLSPRQSINPTPYAIYSTTAGTASTANAVAAANIVGTVPLAQLPSNLVTNGATGVNITGTFSGNGAGVTNLNIATNSGGTIALSGGFNPASSFIVGTGPRSVIAADVNGDGKMDLISANYGTNGTGNTLSILTNNGAGGFTLASTPVVGTGAYKVIATDVNGDNKMDLVCANFNGGSNNTLSILINNGTGGFTLSSSPIVGTGPDSVTAADVNGDGKMDLITANIGNGTIGIGTTLSVLTNDGTGGFVLASTLTVGLGPMGVVATDINGDNKMDLVSVNFYSSTLSLYTNSGNGSFVLSSTITVPPHPNAIAAADVNNDGKMDLVVSTPVNDSLLILTNNGSGTFGTNSTPGLVGPYLSDSDGVTAIATADLNGDGKVDLVCANYIFGTGNTVLVLTNGGNGNFALPLSLIVGGAPFSTIAADVNGDGKPDLISANTTSNTLSVLFNSPSISGNLFGALYGTGIIKSPMWNASTPINFTGGLIVNAGFSTGGGTLVITASGSGYTSGTLGPIGMNILLDGVVVETCQVNANVVNSHMAFVPKTFVRKGVPAGAHTITLQPLPNTLSNVADNYCVTIVEFPF